jgi:hypothetical protein
MRHNSERTVGLVPADDQRLDPDRDAEDGSGSPTQILATWLGIGTAIKVILRWEPEYGDWAVFDAESGRYCACVSTQQEGALWIRGHYVENSDEVKAIRVTRALLR